MCVQHGQASLKLLPKSAITPNKNNALLCVPPPPAAGHLPGQSAGQDSRAGAHAAGPSDRVPCTRADSNGASTDRLSSASEHVLLLQQRVLVASFGGSSSTERTTKAVAIMKLQRDGFSLAKQR